MTQETRVSNVSNDVVSSIQHICSRVISGHMCVMCDTRRITRVSNIYVHTCITRVSHTRLLHPTRCRLLYQNITRVSNIYVHTRRPDVVSCIKHHTCIKHICTHVYTSRDESITRVSHIYVPDVVSWINHVCTPCRLRYQTPTSYVTYTYVCIYMSYIHVMSSRVSNIYVHVPQHRM